MERQRRLSPAIGITNRLQQSSWQTDLAKSCQKSNDCNQFVLKHNVIKCRKWNFPMIATKAHIRSVGDFSAHSFGTLVFEKICCRVRNS